MDGEVDLELLDRAYASIMTSIVETTQAPHFTELGATLGLDPTTALHVMNAVVNSTPGWMHPGTDWLASFPPFNVQPTHYRITVDDRHGWFGQ